VTLPPFVETAYVVAVVTIAVALIVVEPGAVLLGIGGIALVASLYAICDWTDR
jgi:hypothetical protein